MIWSDSARDLRIENMMSCLRKDDTFSICNDSAKFSNSAGVLVFSSARCIVVSWSMSLDYLSRGGGIRFKGGVRCHYGIREPVMSPTYRRTLSFCIAWMPRANTFPPRWRIILREERRRWGFHAPRVGRPCQARGFRLPRSRRRSSGALPRHFDSPDGAVAGLRPVARRPGGHSFARTPGRRLARHFGRQPDFRIALLGRPPGSSG